ncbi:hypothetical protein D6C89_10331, partial [Aureobasidium pullulans]
MSKSSITAQIVCYFEKPRHLRSEIKTKLKARLNIDANRGNVLFKSADGSLDVHHNQQDPQIKGEPATEQDASDRSQAQRRPVTRLLIKMELDLSEPTTTLTRLTTLAMYLPPYDIKAIVASILNSSDVNQPTSEVCGDKGEQKEEAQDNRDMQEKVS